MDNISNYIAVVYGMDILNNKEVQMFIRNLYMLLKNRVGILNVEETLAIRECFGIVRGGDIDKVRMSAINSLDRQIKRIFSDMNDKRLSIFDMNEDISSLRNVTLEMLDLPKYSINKILLDNGITTIEQLVQCSMVKLKQIFAGRTSSYDYIVFNVHSLGLRFVNELSVDEVNSDDKYKKLALNSDIGILNISNSTYNALCHSNIFTVKNLLEYNSFEILGLRNINKRSFGELVSLMHEHGLYFYDEKESIMGVIKGCIYELEMLLKLSINDSKDIEKLLRTKQELLDRIDYLKKIVVLGCNDEMNKKVHNKNKGF